MASTGDPRNHPVKKPSRGMHLSSRKNRLLTSATRAGSYLKSTSWLMIRYLRDRVLCEGPAAKLVQIRTVAQLLCMKYI